MIRKVKTEQLIPGVYIENLNVPWDKHSFMFNQFTIKNTETITKIKKLGIEEVYINTSRGRDIEKMSVPSSMEKKMHVLIQNAVAAMPKILNSVSVEEEITNALKIITDSKEIVNGLLNDVRVGKKMELESATELIEHMIESVSRNRDALVSLLRIKDNHQYTFLHSMSASVLMIAFAKTLDLPDTLVREYALGALLHDIGKMMIPLDILDKPGKLTPPEFLKMKEHAMIGHNILTEMPSFSPNSLTITIQHHERMDGSGYPYGLTGDEISQGGQMAAIVDVYDAITSNRIYNRGIEPVAALKYILEDNSRLFNQDLVHSFTRSVGIYPIGTLVALRCGLLGVVIENNRDDLLAPVLRIVYDSRKKRFVTPRELDLSREYAKGYVNEIVSIENPQDWNIDAFYFMPGNNAKAW